MHFLIVHKYISKYKEMLKENAIQLLRLNHGNIFIFRSTQEVFWHFERRKKYFLVQSCVWFYLFVIHKWNVWTWGSNASSERTSKCPSEPCQGRLLQSFLPFCILLLTSIGEGTTSLWWLLWRDSRCFGQVAGKREWTICHDSYQMPQ